MEPEQQRNVLIQIAQDYTADRISHSDALERMEKILGGDGRLYKMWASHLQQVMEREPDDQEQLVVRTRV